MKGLYLVTPDWDDTDQLLRVTESALQAGIGLLQYRHKTATDALRLTQATALQALCRQYKVPFIINDHLALCEELDADGVHVGGTDATVASVRSIIGPNRIIGASCYGDLQRAQEAAMAGASYVAFGGFYPSRVKKYEVSTPVDIIPRAKSVIDVPVCVIGGMTPENAAPLVAQGADMVAAISSVYQHEHPASAVSYFVRLFAK
jgi:thiamine-phosphate pyrophosphorylase